MISHPHPGSKSSSSIGIRLRQIRESKKMTQQELELAIDASFGHVSRIESGHVNPSKETLIKMAEAMGLGQTETLVLLGLNAEPVTEDEIEQAIAFTTKFLSSATHPIYLCDDFWYIWKANDYLLDLLGAPQGQDRGIFMQQMAGIHLLEYMFNPEYGLRSQIANSSWKNTVLKDCKYFADQINFPLRRGQFWLQELLKKLGQFPDFDDIWGMAVQELSPDSYMEYNFVVPFEMDGQNHEFILKDTVVNGMPRFWVVEFLPRS